MILLTLIITETCMLENHSHPAIRNRRVPVKRSPSPVVPIPVRGEPPTPITPARDIPIPIADAGEPNPKPRPKPKPRPRPSISVDVASLITCIIVNFRTKRLTKQALTTFIKHYPSVHVTLVDNGSHDDSTNLVRQAGNVYSKVQAVLHDTNIGHGPAMHRAILSCDTDYVFTLDSDCIVNRGGFLERMLKRFIAHPSLYAIGWLRHVNPYTGVAAPPGRVSHTGLIQYVHPHAAIYDREKYLSLPPFSHSGAPCITNMREANKRNMRIESFPIDRYVTHLVAGTRRMYQGRWNPKKGEKPGRWNDDRNWPI